MVKTSESNVMTDERITALAEKLMQYIESGEIPEGLCAPDVFMDLTVPTWRFQTQGVEAFAALRKDLHPWPGKVPRWRADATPTGFVIEWEETWHTDGSDWYCREMARVEVKDDVITEISVYCTGDWDAERRADHRCQVQLIRP